MNSRSITSPSPRELPISAPRRLSDTDRPAVREHLLRLSAEDRALRYCSAMSDAVVEARVAALDFERTVCFGRFRAGRLVSFAEGHRFETATGPCIEAAFTTDADYRRAGLARTLVRAVRRFARRASAARVVLHCLARNLPMRALLRSMGANTTCEDGEVEANLSTLHPLRGRVSGASASTSR